DPLYCLWVRVYWGGMERVGEVGPDSLKGKVSGQKVHFEGVFEAPDGVTTAEVLLILRWAGDGVVRWRNGSFAACRAPKPRPVKISTIYWRPGGKQRATVESNVKNFLRMIDRAAKTAPDVIVLSESITAVGVSAASRDDVTHRVPGPVFDQFAEAAKRHKTNLAFSLYERKGTSRVVSAYLVDRKGRLAGRYSKTHCPVGEDTAGYYTGNALPVFDADFGKVAFQICIETAFPEITRVYVAKGAEIILMPSWGASVIDVRARARENGVYCVTAGFDVPSMIVDPRGEILASTWKDHGNGVATATIDLAKRPRSPWTGNMSDYVFRMRRPELYGPLFARDRK
ncbi:MAG: carbon-nitrogen hydrolase family protein, partial [Planctomycetes bacterium]|nr:carbon-nitrogen hydrolase family protein [Planctomycetota bacterium]